MTIIDLKDIDEVFDTIKKLNETEPDKWRQTIVDQLTKNDGIDELRALAKLKAIIQNFVEKQSISCPEAIAQNDNVILNAYEFIEDLVDIVGYKKYDDE